MSYQSTNPASGALVQSFPTISDADLEQAIATAHQAFDHWRRRTVEERAAVLSRAAALLRASADEHARLLSKEMGKLLMEAHGEVALVAGIFDYYARNAAKFLAPKTLPHAPNAEIRIDPIGVLLGIEPWNFPYYQIARVAAPQLVVGNVLLLKHAENVPQSALAFEKLMADAGAPTGVYTNLFATLEQAGRLIEDPRIRGVTLTGSERAGAAVAERAGRHKKKVVLELGGSDPLIVLPDAPLEWAVTGATVGRMFNCGQCCVASKRIIVVGRERGAAFLDAFARQLGGLQPGDPLDAKTTLGPLSSAKALNLLLDQIERAKSAGARVALGGRRIPRPGFYLEPTILTDITASNPIYREELFGPVAQFYIVNDEREAIRLANDTPFGLGASVFTADTDRGRAIAAQIDSGMVFVNRPFGTSPELPFGGVKASGFGRELSELGFEEFVNKKLVNVDPAGTHPFGAAA